MRVEYRDNNPMAINATAPDPVAKYARMLITMDEACMKS